jgi:hypothetical protein
VEPSRRARLCAPAIWPRGSPWRGAPEGVAQHPSRPRMRGSQGIRVRLQPGGDGHLAQRRTSRPRSTRGLLRQPTCLTAMPANKSRSSSRSCVTVQADHAAAGSTSACVGIAAGERLISSASRSRGRSTVGERRRSSSRSSATMFSAPSPSGETEGHASPAWAAVNRCKRRAGTRVDGSEPR